MLVVWVAASVFAPDAYRLALVRAAGYSAIPDDIFYAGFDTCFDAFDEPLGEILTIEMFWIMGEIAGADDIVTRTGVVIACASAMLRVTDRSVFVLVALG